MQVSTIQCACPHTHVETPPHPPGAQPITATSSTAAPWQQPLVDQAIARGLPPLPPAVALGKFDALHRVWCGCTQEHVYHTTHHDHPHNTPSIPGPSSIGSSVWSTKHAAMDGVVLWHGTGLGMATTTTTGCTTGQVWLRNSCAAHTPCMHM